MADFDSNRFESKNQEYETPDSLFDLLDKEFNFTLDVCANRKNKKVQEYFSEKDNALEQDWVGTCWMNPPFKSLSKWIKKAHAESLKHGSTVVCFIPARTNTNWWHEHCMKGEIRFLQGRPKFKGCKHGLPQPLAIIIFGPGYGGMYKSVTGYI